VVTIITKPSHDTRRSCESGLRSIGSTKKWFGEISWLISYYDIIISLVSIFRDGQFIVQTIELSWDHLFAEFIQYGYTRKIDFHFSRYFLKTNQNLIWGMGMSMLGEYLRIVCTYNYEKCIIKYTMHINK